MFNKVALLLSSCVVGAMAHMAMTKPCTRYTPHNDQCPALPNGASFDYNLNSPLGYDEPLCKHTTPYDTPAETWTAGQSVTVKFDLNDGAAHGGGHCQFSLSYDSGKTFVVVHEELKYCFFNGPSGSNTPEVNSYTFNLPSDVPSSDKAIFAWTWVNAVGDREFYMNCADVAIKGSSGSYTGKEIVIANHNGYPTIPEFNGNYDTGLDYYKNAKQVTVTGNGESSGGYGGNGQSPDAPPVGHAAEPSSAPAPSDTYAVPSDTYVAPSTTYDTPSGTYDTLSTTYNTPSDTYVAPSTTYDTPSGTYDTLSTTYNTPSDTYVAPSTTYNTPSDTYVAPSSTYNIPSDTYAAPSPAEPSSAPYSEAGESGSEETLPVPPVDGAAPKAECKDGEIRCLANVRGYQTCMYGKWTAVRKCISRYSSPCKTPTNA